VQAKAQFTFLMERRSDLRSWFAVFMTLCVLAVLLR
jgi:hypothetical protein